MKTNEVFVTKFTEVTLQKEDPFTGYFGNNKPEFKTVSIVDKDFNYDKDKINKILFGRGEFSGWVPDRKTRAKLTILKNEFDREKKPTHH